MSLQQETATVVKAIADAQTVARAIVAADFTGAEASNVDEDYFRPLAQRGNLCADCAHAEKMRCLGCATVCETCCEVCPNRANVAIKVPGKRERQIVHVDGMCNECGNCAVFCPYSEGSRNQPIMVLCPRIGQRGLLAAY